MASVRWARCGIFEFDAANCFGANDHRDSPLPGFRRQVEHIDVLGPSVKLNVDIKMTRTAELQADLSRRHTIEKKPATAIDRRRCAERDPPKCHNPQLLSDLRSDSDNPS